jgi:hypothetical protein
VKREALALTLITALLFSAIAGARLSLLAKANFVFPPANPRITITSPTNNTSYNVSTLSLEVTFETYKTGYEEPSVSNTTRLFTYALDWKQPENITITNATVASYPGGNVFFAGSANLANLTEGLHNLTVHVVFDYFQLPNDSFHTESESTLYFKIEPAPHNISILMPDLLPILLVTAVSVVTIGVLVYFKKRKH